MNIAVDMQSAVGEKTGIGVYARHILEALRKIDHRNTYTEYCNPEWKELNTIKRVIWESLIVPTRLMKTRPDLLFVPGFSPPLIKSYKTVTILHDLIGVLFPENLGFFSRIYWSKWLPFCVKNSDFIVCDSMSTQKDCIRITGCREDKTKVIYPGMLVENNQSAGNDDADVMKRYGINAKYVLTVSTIEPRKNFLRLVEAWKHVKSSVKENISLVIVGKKGWGWPALEEKIKSLGMETDVITVGYVSDNEKNSLYKNCEFFIFPSIYEGFGFPVLEAMSFNKAVIVSHNSSLVEVAGETALYMDPYNTKEISSAIIALIKNRCLRDGLAQKGFDRSRLFSWEKSARELIDIFEDVAGGSD